MAKLYEYFGIPKDGSAAEYKRFQRLAAGRLREKREDVARELIDRIVTAFVCNNRSGATDKVLTEKDVLSRKYTTWQWSESGEFLHLQDHLVRELVEFVHRHELLVHKFGSGDSDVAVKFRWLGMYVIPFLVFNLAEYQTNGSNLEKGMPGGEFWYLPQVDHETGCIRLPVHNVLSWWQDLLGVPLADIAQQLCGSEDVVDAQAQIRHWMTEDRPPSIETIAVWAGASLPYRGIFVARRDLPPKGRWEHCQVFLKQKGFNPITAHLLERQIRPLRNLSFGEFFKGDAVDRGLPTDELIQRLEERYAKPGRQQLRSRFLIAAAFQRAFADCRVTLGDENTAMLHRWFLEFHGRSMELFNACASPAAMAAHVRQLPEEDDFKKAVEWLLDQDAWKIFPAELAQRFLRDRANR